MKIKVKKVQKTSIRHSKRKITLCKNETLYTLSELLSAIEIKKIIFINIVNKISAGNNRLISRLLDETEYKILHKYIYTLATYGLEYKQIAYFLGNRISPSVLARYVKAYSSTELLQKAITTYMIIKTSDSEHQVLNSLDEKKSIEELLEQNLLFCEFGTDTRISLKKIVTLKEKNNRKK